MPKTKSTAASKRTGQKQHKGWASQGYDVCELGAVRNDGARGDSNGSRNDEMMMKSPR
jgi:hypothetical protein